MNTIPSHARHISTRPPAHAHTLPALATQRRNRLSRDELYVALFTAYMLKVTSTPTLLLLSVSPAPVAAGRRGPAGARLPAHTGA